MIRSTTFYTMKVTNVRIPIRPFFDSGGRPSPCPLPLPFPLPRKRLGKRIYADISLPCKSMAIEIHRESLTYLRFLKRVNLIEPLKCSFSKICMVKRINEVQANGPGFNHKLQTLSRPINQSLKELNICLLKGQKVAVLVVNFLEGNHLPKSIYIDNQPPCCNFITERPDTYNALLLFYFYSSRIL